MPDLTIEVYPMCASLSREVQYQIGGYVQTLYHGVYQMNDHCTCPAHKYHRNKVCKHLQEAYNQECGWHGAYDEPQIEDGVCPRCGGPTEYVRVGV